MSTAAEPKPRCRSDVQIQHVSPTETVVKLKTSREYFSVGSQEAWLLQQFNGRRTARRVRRKYEKEFGESISLQEVTGFLESVQQLGLLEEPDCAAESTGGEANGTDPKSRLTEASGQNSAVAARSAAGSPTKAQAKQSLLFFRKSLFDPDALFNALEPRLRWIWTRGFAVCAVIAVLLAVCVSVSNRAVLVDAYPNLMSWESVLLFVGVLLLTTLLHELAHGLTCKHFGGEVHEIGLLFMFFLPCMYCNVSDAWLIPEKHKRLLITIAGACLDLCVWAVAVFVWRITVPGVLVNQLALIVLTVTGGRSFLNLNPLLRLDGYYLMVDWLSIPNLRSRGMATWMAQLRHLLWGAARPAAEPQGRVLLWYGFACWVFALGLLNVILIKFVQFMTTEFGVVGLGVICLFLMFGVRRVSKGLFESEFSTMIKTRPKRTTVWLAVTGTALVLIFAVPVRSSSSGDFEVRPGSVVQVHVPVSGIVDEILVDDGQAVEAGQLLVRLRSPDLVSQIQVASDLLTEVEANLQRLKCGTRPEELSAQQQQVARLQTWYELGVEELQQAVEAHQQELVIEESRIREASSAVDYARQNLAHAERLYQQGALAGAQLRSERLQIVQAESRLAQAEAALKVLRARGTRTKQAEIDRRRQELESAKERLGVMQAGSRPEEIAAEEARLQRVQHELSYLQEQQQRLEIRASSSGVVSAQRLREQLGKALVKDSVICSIEDPTRSWVEIAIAEEHAPLVQAGLPVRLKARAVPFESFQATVESVSPAARRAGDAAANTVVVNCQIRNPDGRLKPGMTGFGRIYRDWRSIGTIMTSKALKYIRTEFWW